MVEMNFRSWRRLIWTAVWLMALGIIGVACAAVFLPLDPEATKPPHQTNGERPKVETDPSPKKVPPLESYACVYQRDLRKPLFDPAVSKTGEPAKPKRKLAATLVGTAVDPGLTYGIFRDSKGKTVLVKVGQVVDDAEVVSVEDGTATVKFDGETITLNLPGKEKKP